MPDVIGFVLISMVIGGVIGGGTNRLAIAMLFRPHRVIRLWGKALPFTPGLIPKRRRELAQQLGRTVREYLVNGEALSRTMQHADMQARVTAWAQAEWRRLLKDQQLYKRLRSLIEWDETKSPHGRDVKIGEWLSTRTTVELKKLAAEGAPLVSERLLLFLHSAEGSAALRRIFRDWTKRRGWVGRLTGTLLDEARMAEKSKEWLTRLLQTPHGIDIVRRLIAAGVDAALACRVRDVLAWTERRVEVSSAAAGGGEALIERIVPHLLEHFASHGEAWLDLLQLDALVTEQVETFSLPKLEEMIVRVAKKELRLITWLGVFIGSVVGLCQGLILGMMK